MSSQNLPKAHPWDVLIRKYEAEIRREQNYHPDPEIISDLRSKIQALSTSKSRHLPKGQPLNQTCLICNRADGRQTVQLLCNHLYHSECLYDKLCNSESCPTCGRNIVEQSFFTRALNAVRKAGSGF